MPGPSYLRETKIVKIGYSDKRDRGTVYPTRYLSPHSSPVGEVTVRPKGYRKCHDLFLFSAITDVTPKQPNSNSQNKVKNTYSRPILSLPPGQPQATITASPHTKRAATAPSVTALTIHLCPFYYFTTNLYVSPSHLITYTPACGNVTVCVLPLYTSVPAVLNTSTSRSLSMMSVRPSV